jgi:predicted Fe-Mo cluster-binding NifX family protein
MNKIAIPSDGDKFAQHFGRCPQYTFYTIEDREIKDKEVIPNPGHKPGYLPRFLKEKGVDCVITSGMGKRAKDIFDENGIEVIIGVQGNIEKKVRSYLNEDLEEGENICSH